MQVPKETFGLSTADILSLSDKELNQVVGLRKIAPYREERNPRKARYQTMHRLRNLATSAAQVCRLSRCCSGSDIVCLLLGTDYVSFAAVAIHQEHRTCGKRC